MRGCGEQEGAARMLQTAPDSCAHTTRWERWSPTPSFTGHVPGEAYSGEAAPGAPSQRWEQSGRTPTPLNVCREPEGSRTASAPRSPHVRVPPSPALPRDVSASIGGGGEFPSARSCIIESPSPLSSSRTAEGIPPVQRSAPLPSCSWALRGFAHPVELRSVSAIRVRAQPRSPA